MAISESSIDPAPEKGRQLDQIQPKAVAVRIESTRLILGFNNGAEVIVPMALLPDAVAGASLHDAAKITIEGGGHDLSWRTNRPCRTCARRPVNSVRMDRDSDLGGGRST